MMRSLTKNDLLELFTKIDKQLVAPMRITVLGGTAIVLYEFTDRTTIDIDIAPNDCADNFAQLCKKHGIPVDIITMTSTVDLPHCNGNTMFQGNSLTITAIDTHDLIKTKLERYVKHDADDICAIIRSIELPFETFLALYQDMKTDFIGNPTPLRLSARDIVERMYSDNVSQFDQTHDTV